MNIHTYEITVRGFSPILYSARKPGQARASAFRSYCSAYPNCTFCEFLKISSVKLVDDPPGIHRRILVQGEPATLCLPSGRYGAGNYVYYMRDDNDHVMCSHPLDVQEIEDGHGDTDRSGKTSAADLVDGSSAEDTR